MLSVLHFRRQLVGPPVVADVAGILVRNFVVPDDIGPWLVLRDRAMVDERPRARAWSESDFRSEMINKPWWRADRCWVAVDRDRTTDFVGSVTLAIRESDRSKVPVVHWLVVDPEWRRRGVGRLLMSHLELAAWEDGWREIELETHVGWAAAVALYHSMGYAPVRDRSPRCGLSIFTRPFSSLTRPSASSFSTCG